MLDDDNRLEVKMARKMADCRRFESESKCTLTIIGEEDEVIETAVQHAAAVHDHQDSPEMREQLRAMLEPEENYIPGARAPEPFPSG
jgi:plasmid stability protein